MTAEFTEYRPYRPGDDSRRLDWKLLARTDRAYLRITDDHATRATLILLDASASLAFPATTLAKWRQACRLAVGLATVARGGGDPVGLIVPGGGSVLRLPPRTRRGVVAEIARTLAGIVPAGSPTLSHGLEGMRPGWRVAIVSDFLGDEPGLLTRARQLVVEGAEVFAIHIVANEEAIPPIATRLAIDPEDPTIRRVLHESVWSAYEAEFTAWRAAVADGWRRAGAEYTEVRAEEETASAIRRIVRGGPTIGPAG